MAWRSVGVIGLCGALSVLIPEAALAQLAHPGYSGLISTPDATVLPQGQIALGFTLLEGPNSYLFTPKSNRIYAITVGILPGLEATLRQTQVIGWHDPEAPGVKHAFDRMFSAKYAIPLPEGYPQLAFGMQDIASGNFLSGFKNAKPGATQYGQSTLYGVVGSKYSNWAWHGGFGASQAFINGIFAGISYKPIENVYFLGEWDSQGFNWGVHISPFQALVIQVSTMKFDTWAVGASAQINL